MKEQDGHFHARSRYASIGWRDYLWVLQDMHEVKRRQGKSLNIHLPFEIQHPQRYPTYSKGIVFIRYAEQIKKIFKIPLYWENSPELRYGTWDLMDGQTDWSHVPKGIDLTLDTGHLMLGSKDIHEARDHISHVLYQQGEKIKHLHIHENDYVHDWHWPIGRTITKPIFVDMIQGRSYIFEKDIVITGESPLPPYTPLTDVYVR